jgi:hypothetical protein
MASAGKRERGRKGWLVEVTGHRVGDAPRTGEILTVLGAGPHEHYRVRWEDGHESLFFPGSDVVVRPPRRSPDV